MLDVGWIVGGSQLLPTSKIQHPTSNYCGADCDGIWMIFFWIAYCTSCALLWISNLRIRLNLCASTVFTLRFSPPAISLTELPSARTLSTSFSRVVSVAKRGVRCVDFTRERKSSTSCDSILGLR